MQKVCESKFKDFDWLGKDFPFKSSLQIDNINQWNDPFPVFLGLLHPFYLNF